MTLCAGTRDKGFEDGGVIREPCWRGFQPSIPLDVRQEADGELVRLAGKGHQDAWSELVHRFGGLVHRMAKRQGLNDSDAADVAQLTWLRLMGHMDQVRDPARIGGWLATTARRESVRMAVRVARDVPSGAPVGEDAGAGQAKVAPGADASLLRAQYDPEIEGALAKLPPRYQRLLRLLTSDAGLSYAQIAPTLGIPIGSVGPMRLRALQLLRNHPPVRTIHEGPGLARGDGGDQPPL
jgi:RNA polymerase sigma factor (sigma-70 family)